MGNFSTMKNFSPRN